MSERATPPPGKASGLLITEDRDGAPVLQADTVSCCHCGRVWRWQPGSGKRRGFCLKCNKFTCGSAACDPCVPVDQVLDNIEAGRPLDFRPVRVHIPTAPPTSPKKLVLPDGCAD